MNKQEIIKRLKQSRDNINWILEDLQPPAPPPHNVCKLPLWEVGKVNGWSGAGYETLAWKGIDFDLWDDVADLLAKERVNFHRFFAYCSENNFYLSNTFHPYPKYPDGYELEEIDPDYYEAVKPRLRSYQDRKIVTQVCLGSGIKNLPADDPRWSHSFFNGKNNRNGTTTDHRRFYDDAQTKKMFKAYIRNFCALFDNPYLMYQLMNEPATSIGRIVDWSWEMIGFLHDNLGVPYNRISICYFDSSKVYDFLDKGIYVSRHAINSARTVRIFTKSADRIPLLKSPTFILCGDGGDEFNEAWGFTGAEWSKDFQKAAARQEREMIRTSLQAGGAGLDFMPALAFLDGRAPNLQRILDHGADGFSKQELQELTKRIGVDFMKQLSSGEYYNQFGELKECRAAFTNNI